MFDMTIDDVTNLADVAAYIVSTTYKNDIPAQGQEAQRETYLSLGANASLINYLEQDELTWGLPAEMVQWLLENLGYETSFVDPVDKPKDYGAMYTFDQWEIAGSIPVDFDQMQMQQNGKIYIPDQCLEEEFSGRCHAHVAFYDSDGKNKAKKWHQLNHFAAVNNIIMVYPHSEVAWDVFGELDEDYATQNGDYS